MSPLSDYIGLLDTGPFIPPPPTTPPTVIAEPRIKGIERAGAIVASASGAVSGAPSRPIRA